MLNSKTVFVLAPHPDDAEIGCGGTIARLFENKADIYFLVFGRDEKRKRELNRSARFLGVKKVYCYDVPIRQFHRFRQEILDKLIEAKKFHRPDLVIQPSLDDIHQDHQVIAREGLRAFKDTNLIGYEASWNNLKFDAQMFVRLEKKHVQKKLTALSAYKSQSGKGYMDHRYMVGLMRVRGVQVGVEYAELFNVVRQVIL